jgi:hypothetical protein
MNMRDDVAAEAGTRKLRPWRACAYGRFHEAVERRARDADFLQPRVVSAHQFAESAAVTASKRSARRASDVSHFRETGLVCAPAGIVTLAHAHHRVSG